MAKDHLRSPATKSVTTRLSRSNWPLVYRTKLSWFLLSSSFSLSFFTFYFFSLFDCFSFLPNFLIFLYPNCLLSRPCDSMQAEIDEACREIDVIADQVDYLMITIFEFIRSVAVASLPRESIHSIFCEVFHFSWIQVILVLEKSLELFLLDT